MKNGVFKLIKINRSIVVGIIINLFAIVMTVLVPLSVKEFIDSNNEYSMNFNWAFVIFGLLILQTIFTSIGTYLITSEGEKQIAKIRINIKEHILNLPVKYFDANNSGAISSRVINDATLLRNFLTINIPQMINGLTAILTSMAILLYLDWKLASLLFIIFPLNVLLTFPMSKLSRKISMETQRSLSNLIGITSENISNIRTIKLNTAEQHTLSKFTEEGDQLKNLSIKSNLIFAIVNPSQKLFAVCLIILVVLYGGYRVEQGTLSTGTMISFMIFLFQLIGPVNSVADFYNHYMRAQGATEKINEILEENSEEENSKNDFNKVDTWNFQVTQASTLKLSNICFSHGQRSILHDINMEFKKGEKIAIVGPTGSGKSTLINLITRLYLVDEGEILLNERNSYNIQLHQWRNLFGVVSQENSILSGTIYDNLVLGLKEIPNDSDIHEALEMSCLSNDVSKFPNGIQTSIGEKGMNLSGGQRQRLQIARAILKNAQYLILDEATSSLDSFTEKTIIKNLSSSGSKKTVISIAHRLSTIVDADRIYFIDNGTIKDSGSHTELLKKVPKYKRFVEDQLIKDNEITNVG